jgi:hypothetical protein
MDLNQRPQRKKTIPLRLQDPKENITSGSKRPAKSEKIGIDNKPEEKKIKIHDVIKPALSHFNVNIAFKKFVFC